MFLTIFNELFLNIYTNNNHIGQVFTIDVEWVTEMDVLNSN